MADYILLIAIGLMILSAILPGKLSYRKLIGAFGWITFGAHWAYQPIHYMGINDYFNVFLTIMIACFCLMMAYSMIDEYRSKTLPVKNLDITSMVTSATAIGSLFYFPFAQLPSLNYWIIATVTDNVVWLLGALGYQVTQDSWNLISYNGYTVEIILACTAIESIALFSGLIVSVRAPASKLFQAFMVSVPVIYILNIFRDAFVIIVYGEQWFGAESFEIAHHMIAKMGSAVALFVIGYAVLKILPQLFDLIDGLVSLSRFRLKDIIDKIAGNR